MRFCKEYQIDQGIRGFKLGWSFAGPPLMTVYCYFFGHIMIDTGQSHMKNEVVSIAIANGVESIFLTHHHEDHSGNAAAIHSSLGASVYGHSLSREKLKSSYPILPYQKYVWGKTTPVKIDPFPEKIETTLGTMVPIHTPGHSKDHTLFLLPDKGILFSGDLYLADRIKFFRSDENLGEQIDSLKKVTKLNFDLLLCAHNPKLKNGREHLCLKLGFLENFYGEIVDLWVKGWSAKHIFDFLKLKESYFIKYFCCGNVSMLNGVKSAIRHYETYQQHN
ncbi:MAG: MBL fold metallo-hydrolase [Desulfamplus sp.]|nr:MBL fold metallo-hydrolase [Desulfamplus sp.]